MLLYNNAHARFCRLFYADNRFKYRNKLLIEVKVRTFFKQKVVKKYALREINETIFLQYKSQNYRHV